MIDLASTSLVCGAALLGGAINAVAGGGSLITFPALVLVGLPPVTANVTNTVALCPGYLGATLAQRKDLVGQGRRAARLLPIAALGGAGGALLLLATDEGSFRVLVPFLILLAAALVGLQPRVRTWLVGRAGGGAARAEGWAVVPAGLAAIYGGYFGAGMSVMILAALGMLLEGSLTQLNALKQTVALCANVSATVIFVGWGPVDWPIGIAMAMSALAGGALGGLLASKVPPHILRGLIVSLGVVVAGVYFARL